MSPGRRVVRFLMLGLLGLGLASAAVALVAGRRDARVVRVEPAEHFTPEHQEIAADYAGLKYSYWAAGSILRWGMLAAIVAMGGGTALANLGRRLSRGHRFATIFLATAALLGLLAVASLPIAFQSGYRTERAFGLTSQSTVGWLFDWLREGAFWILVYSAVAAGFLIVIDRYPKRGWAFAALGAVLLAMAGTFLAPRLIDPLFHRFTPLEDRQLARDIGELGERAGIEVRRVVVMDASRRTNRLNAYVTGLGSTHQVVLYDNLLDKAPRPEVLLVVAHEIAHTAGHHLRRGLLWSIPAIVLGCWALAWLARAHARERGLSGPGEPAGIPLLWLALSLALFLASPATSAIARRMEAEADWISLELTRDPSTFVGLSERLAVVNLAPVDPPRWLVFWLYSHPPVLERLGMARYWEAENPALGDIQDGASSP